MSINQYVLYTLTKEISYKEAERRLKERIRKTASHEDALRLLDAIVSDVPALPQIRASFRPYGGLSEKTYLRVKAKFSDYSAKPTFG